MRTQRFSIISRFGPYLFFALYAVIGLFLFNDYGCGPDEGMERQTSLVNFRYVIETLQIPVPESTTTWLAYLPDLHEYRDRYYGIALHFPLVVIESLFNFQMQPIEFYSLRHFYTFLNYFIAMICFYRLLLFRFKAVHWALLGTLMVILTPRFFAESFYNNKDILFFAWYIISLAFILRWFHTKSYKNAALTGIILAFTCNTRLNGIVFYPLIIAFVFLEFLNQKRISKQTLVSVLFLFLVSASVFYIITPNFWEHPIQTALETFAFNRRHPNHGSTGNLFLGKLVDTTQVWYFIPVWITITTPFIYLFYSGIGFFIVLWQQVKNRFIKFQNFSELMDLFVISSGFLPIIVIIAFDVIIYNGWRHCYFAYSAIVYLAVAGIVRICRGSDNPSFWHSAKKVGLILSLVLSFGFNVIWIWVNHPYEYVYFNPFARKYSVYFSGDYWGVASRDLLQYIIDHDSRPQIIIDHSYTQAGSINRGLLAESDRARINLVYEKENADYILFSRDDKKPEEANIPGFEKIFSIQVDDDEIGIVLRKTGNE